MRTLRLTASKLEEYRCFLDEEYNGYITQEKVIESIKGEKAYTPTATFGTAFGLVVENGAMKYFDQESKQFIIQEGNMPEPVTLSYEEISKADALHKAYPGATYESWHWVRYRLDRFTMINMPLKTDFLHGLTIHEVKTTKGKVEYDFYHRSVQWKCYLHFLQAHKIKYHIYGYNPPGKRIQTYRVKDPVHFEFMPYPTLEQDIKEYMHDFIDFCETLNLIDYIDESKRKK